MLKEIVLVDDDSDMEHLKNPLVEYMAKYPKVKVVRAGKRVSLSIFPVIHCGYLPIFLYFFLV